MKSLKNTITFVAGVSLLVTLMVAFIFFGKTAAAQDCGDYEDQAVGNLSGYILASNLPSFGDQNKIWVSSEDDPWEGGPDYGVSYDRNLHLFSGRGWNEGLRVWVDFDYASSDQARVLDASGNPVGGFGWGYWNGEIQGLDGLEYSTNEGAFLGDDPYDTQYISGTSDGDVLIGLGYLSFDNVIFVSDQVPIECQSYVDVYANGGTAINLPVCGQSTILTWNSVNVVDDSCTTVDNGAPWPNPGESVNEINTTGVSSGQITSELSPAFFKISCISSITGNPVTGIAKVSCASPEELNEDIPFDYIES